MSQLTDKGYERTRLPERLEALKSEVKGVFGQDINLDADSMDGQAVGIYAAAIDDLDQLIEATLKQFNPQTATGLHLSRLVQLNGIRRIGGRHSVVTLRCVGQAGTVIPAGSLVKSTFDDVFSTVATATIDNSGFVDVVARSQQMGAIAVDENTVTVIASPIYGWQTVTNPARGELGSVEETDAQLRRRRRYSTATPGQSPREALEGALNNIPDVVEAIVWENYNDQTDERGLPGHSVYCVVRGGEPDEIAKAILLRKSAGCNMHGNVTAYAKDSNGHNHLMRFSRPAEISCRVAVTLRKTGIFPNDGAERIKTALAQFFADNQGIGARVIRSRLYTPINEIAGHSVEALQIRVSGGTFSDMDIVIPFDAIATLSADYVTVTVLE